MSTTRDQKNPLPGQCACRMDGWTLMPCAEHIWSITNECKYYVNPAINQRQMGKTVKDENTKVNSPGKKFDAGKPSMSLLPGRSLKELAKVMDYGATKYATHNWRKGINHSRVLDAALRHLYSYADGERIDPESNLSHLAHAAVNILFLLEYLETHKELDDCYKKENK